jgi:L-asparagine transporter-like permease
MPKNGGCIGVSYFYNHCCGTYGMPSLYILLIAMSILAAVVVYTLLAVSEVRYRASQDRAYVDGELRRLRANLNHHITAEIDDGK